MFRHVLVGDNEIAVGQIGNLSHDDIILPHRGKTMPTQDDLYKMRVLLGGVVIRLNFQRE